jgi:integrase
MAKLSPLIKIRHLEHGRIAYRVEGTKFGAVPARPQFPTREAAEAALARMIEERGAGPNPTARDVTFKTQAESYINRNRLSDDGETGLADKTIRNFESCIRANLVPALGAKRIVDCNEQVLRQFITEKSKTMGRASMKLIRNVLRGIFDSAVADDLLRSNPMRDVRLPNDRSRSAAMKRAREDKVGKERVFTQAQIDAILSWCAANDEELGTYVFVMLRLGCRKGEARALKWGKIHGDKIRIDENADDRNKISHTKTGVTRECDATPELLEVLRKHKIVREQTGHGTAPENYVFGNGVPIADRSISARFDKCLDVLGIEDHSVYDLRHTCASVLYQRCRDILYCAKHIGDKPATFLQFYAHHLPDSTIAYANLLDKQQP